MKNISIIYELFAKDLHEEISNSSFICNLNIIEE